MNIYKKMQLATAQIETVAKNLKVDFGKGSYKAVGEGDVLRAVKPIEADLGIYSYPLSRTVIETATLTTVKEYNGNRTESNQLFMRLETVYRFVNVDNPEEYIDITTYGDGVDSQDKAPGKAMTYADKYALLKAYKIETGDDPDKDGSGELKNVANKKVEKAAKSEVVELATDEQIDLLVQLEPQVISKMVKFYGVNSVKDIPKIEAEKVITQKGLRK